MALVKNELPILEYDTEQKAVIMPGHHSDYQFPERAVMLFMESEISDFVAENECEIIGKFVSVTKDFYRRLLVERELSRLWNNSLREVLRK